MSTVTDALIADFDEAVSRDTDEAVCEGIKTALETHLKDGRGFLPEEICAPASDRYARRLLHKDPEGRYSVVIMVWGVGQQTALHDHAGNWCVEGVYRGRIKVTNYALEGQPTPEGVYRFEKSEEILGTIGEAGALIPPYEYHTIANEDPAAPSVTIHVYKGEMKNFAAFVPVEGGYKKEIRDTYYTD
jgi:predicted metal-dependent enzyme (double-stranded beta helix superfamily)